MNIAVIFAGGVGARMNSGVPKQFLTVYDKPIIIHTLEKFQYCDDIDAIVIACVESHIERLAMLCERFNMTKVRKICKGGTSGQLSIYNGLCAAKEISNTKDDIVLIHDGVRPVIEEELLSRAVCSVKENGSAIACAPCVETVALVAENGDILSTTDRSKSFLARAPQCFYLKDILCNHEKALSEGREDFIDSCSMMAHYGAKLHMVECSRDNIKITTPDDFFLFKAILEARQNSQAF